MKKEITLEKRKKILFLVQMLLIMLAVMSGAVMKVIVLAWGDSFFRIELIDFCKEHLADYKRPKSVNFYKELPHTAAGKIMYAELRKMCQRS